MLTVGKQLTPQQEASFRDMMRDGLGLVEGRDSWTVRSAPMFVWQPTVAPEVAPPPDTKAPSYTYMPFAAGLMVGAVAIALVMWTTARRGSTHTPELKPEKRVESTDLVDLLTTREGRSAAPTALTRREAVLRLAEEKPRRVAELLRSQWLVETSR